MLSDLKYALRSLMKTPGFTVVAILTLALGIGATTVIFSVVNTVLLRPLPYTQPERLTRIYTEFPTFEHGSGQRFWVSKPEYLELQREVTSWESIDAWSDSGVNITAASQPVRVTAAFVTGGMLRTLGAIPTIGRALNTADDVPGATSVATISYGLWQSMFAGDRAILGRNILLNGRKCTIVGVMSQEFRFPPGEVDAPEIWTPLQIDPANPGDSTNHSLSVLGRLKPGVTLRQAQMELDSLVRHWGQTGSGHHFDPKFHTLKTYGLHEEVVRGVRPALKMLLGAVCFLLLIACVNVANLFLTRAETRQREVSIRGALGAGLGRIALQFLSEGICLSSLGVASGLLLAHGGLALLKFAGAANIPRAAEIGIDGRVILFTVAVSMVTGVIFSLAPIVHVRKNLHGVMKSTAAPADTQAFRRTLVVSEIALALILLIGTGLMLRAFWKLQDVNPGFDPKSVMTMAVVLPSTTYPIQAARDFWTRLGQGLDTLPGVESAALTSSLPPVNQPSYATVEIEGIAPREMLLGQNIDYYQMVDPGYFSTLRIRLLEGRLLDLQDFGAGSTTVLINQTMARNFWGNASPIGHRIHTYIGSGWLTVVGVVADVKNGGVGNPTGTAVYFPYTMAMEHGDIFGDLLRTVHIVLRYTGSSAPLVKAVRRAVGNADPTLPLTEIHTMDEVMSLTQSGPRFLTILLTLFASAALTLSAVGVYGVVSYSVAQRTREFGVRIAIGAQRGDVLGLVLRGGLVLALLGILVGIAGAFVLTRFMAGFLFGVTPTDPATFAIVSMLLGAVAVIAGYLPARCATQVDPLIALRTE